MNEITKNSLMKNWGEKADTLNCYAEVKFIDPSSDWCCYVYALNPNDEDEIDCLIDGFDLEFTKWSLKELYQRYNNYGEYVTEDKEFKRIRIDELYKRLR